MDSVHLYNPRTKGGAPLKPLRGLYESTRKI
jgi:hypothetical protein